MIRSCDAPGCRWGTAVGWWEHFFGCLASKLRGGTFTYLVFCPEHKERMLGVDDGDPTTNPDLNKEPEAVPVYEADPEADDDVDLSELAEEQYDGEEGVEGEVSDTPDGEDGGPPQPEIVDEPDDPPHESEEEPEGAGLNAAIAEGLRDLAGDGELESEVEDVIEDVIEDFFEEPVAEISADPPETTDDDEEKK